MAKPVSSDEMLAFYREVTTQAVKLDQDGNPVYMLEAPLKGDALAEALKALVQVIDIEHRFTFAREHAQCQQEQRLPGLGGMAN